MAIAACGASQHLAAAIAADAAGNVAEGMTKDKKAPHRAEASQSQPGRLLSVTIRPFEIGSLQTSAYGDQGHLKRTAK